MLVTVRRRANGKVDSVTIYPEHPPEEGNLTNLINNKVNLVKGILLLNKEDRLVERNVADVGDEVSVDSSPEVYRHQ